MPIARSSVLWGHVLTSLVSNAISVVVIVLVALLMGFRSSAGVLAWLAVAGILVLFTLALTWIAVIAGLSAKSTDGAVAFSYPIIFLPFVSSAFVPTASMPGPVRAFAENQPATSIVNTIRALFEQQPVGGESWIALAWCVGILLIAYALAVVAYRRKIVSNIRTLAALQASWLHWAGLRQPIQNGTAPVEYAAGCGRGTPTRLQASTVPIPALINRQNSSSSASRRLRPRRPIRNLRP
jgi:hypothetical protein